MNVSVEIRKRCLLSPRMYVAAIQPAKASAAWPEGSPPRSGVPRPVSAFVEITTMIVTTSAIRVRSIGAFRTRSSSRELGSESRRAKTR